MKSIFALALIVTGLTGCGQTGPLYMPKPTARPPLAQPAPPVVSTVPAQPAGSASE